jgi:murein DD-endopeptidase MepM/ murein hydrolase activator NlpD
MTARAWTLLAVALVAVGAASLVWVRCEGTPPGVDAPAGLTVGAAGHSVEILLADGETGLAEAEVVLAHARGTSSLAEKKFESGRIPLWSARPRKDRLTLTIDPKALELRDGDAFLRITVRDGSWRNGFRGNESSLEVPIRIDLQPPRIQLESGLTYVSRGGAAVVVYQLSEAVERDGVEVGGAFFRGHPLPRSSANGSEPKEEPRPSHGRRLGLFAIPVDAPPNPPVRVIAVDAAGNRATSRIAARIQERDFPQVPIRLSQNFLEGKVMELASVQGIGASDPLAAFQEINGAQRARDEARVRELARSGAPTRLFRGAFKQLRNSKVTSRYAEQRRYFFEGRKVAEATHFGFDLATVAGGPVTASNAGTVLHADRMGIYGQCVLIDHGLGLVSLYGHLSRLDVAGGDSVEQGQVIGRSGQTGLAGGDHLHFAMLVDGVYVDPVEWWDRKWVREHFEARAQAHP